jgi:hypothetical protein
VSDIFSFELADGLASGACPLCYALDVDIRRWLDFFWREGRQNTEARKQFFAGGGFCRRHAWQLHASLADHSGAAIADLYGRLAERDQALLDDLLAHRAPPRKALQRLLRPRECAACVWESEALERKASFFLDLLATDAGRERYERSRGACFGHLLALLEAVEDDELGTYLLADWRQRLEQLQRRLARYDRTRDHRYIRERTADDERSWTDVIHQYAGTGISASAP